MAFTAQEQARILHHLGYPSWVSLSNGIQLGFPAGAQPLFLVEQSFLRLTAGGEDSVREDLCNCEDAEGQLGTARSRMKATQLGELHLNPREAAMLRGELQYWRAKLADDLGVVRNPYSQSAYQGDPGGPNAWVEE